MAKLYLRKMGGMLFADDEQSKKHLQKIKAGSVISCEVKKPRNIRFHRKYFALLNYSFECWNENLIDNSNANFDAFREEITIRSGHYTKTIKFNGDVRYIAKSISFARMEELDFNELYSKTIDVILKHVLKNYTKDDLNNVVMDIIRFT